MEQDIELMLQVKEDDIKSFEKLYHQYQKPVGNFFLRMGCDQSSSEDYVQEVFLRIWKSRKTYQPMAKFTTFLFQIAKNYWLNEVEKKKRRPMMQYLYSIFGKGDETQTRFPDTHKSPQDQMITEELQEKLQEAINSLPPKQRLVFVLSEIEGLKYNEIAKILNIPVGTVKSRMFIGEEKLRQKLREYMSLI